LFVSGRFKSLLIAGDGEKYSPEGIEEAIAELSPYIDYCVLYFNFVSISLQASTVPGSSSRCFTYSVRAVLFGTIRPAVSL